MKGITKDKILTVAIGEKVFNSLETWQKEQLYFAMDEWALNINLIEKYKAWIKRIERKQSKCESLQEIARLEAKISVLKIVITDLSS